MSHNYYNNTYNNYMDSKPNHHNTYDEYGYQDDFSYQDIQGDEIAADEDREHEVEYEDLTPYDGIAKHKYEQTYNLEDQAEAAQGLVDNRFYRSCVSPKNTYHHVSMGTKHHPPTSVTTLTTMTILNHHFPLTTLPLPNVPIRLIALNSTISWLTYHLPSPLKTATT